MTPFQQDQLLDQVRANGNWIEPMENGLTLDGHFQLADLRKLVLLMEAKERAAGLNLQNAAETYRNVGVSLAAMGKKPNETQ